jgi:hypothetical protein
MNYYNYFTEIEDEFVKRRGSHILISPLDWSLIETWRQRAIPLAIVLRGINASFDTYERLPRRGRKVNSLFYCQQEVEASFEQYCESRVGATQTTLESSTGAARASESQFSLEAVIAYLTERCEAIERLRENSVDRYNLAETFARAARRLRDLIEGLKATGVVAPERLESDLTRTEELILEGLRESTAADELNRMQRDAQKQLKNYKEGMGQEVYEQTLRNYLARRLRERFVVPRLSLFYL